MSEVIQFPGGIDAEQVWRDLMDQYSKLPSDWMVMEFAPKDGTKIDLLFPGPRGRTIDCFWGVALGSPRWIWLTPRWDKGELLPEDKWQVHCYPSMEPLFWMFPPALPLSPSTAK